MGWGNCGTDSRGRGIGYYHAARCDQPGCRARIDRGLSYACGGMHGNECLGGDNRIDWSAMVEVCDQYFCEKHLRFACLEHEDGTDLYSPMMCSACAEKLERAYREDPDWREHWPTGSPPLPCDSEERRQAETAQPAQGEARPNDSRSEIAQTEHPTVPTGEREGE
jgi:hypothetical protein